MLSEGQQLSHYRLVRLLKSGGMGEVYLAVDTLLHRQVAIKVIDTDALRYAESDAAQDAARLFLREAQAIAQLDQANILPLYDSGEQSVSGTALMYMVMPYRQAGSLADWKRAQFGEHLLPLDAVERIVSQAALALQHAHDRQIIHQDVKPSNFLVHGEADHPSRLHLQLADFGVAKFMMMASESQVIRGTPAYMAPEQWDGHPVPATDQYALAIMAYELLVGRPPFVGNGFQHMWHQHSHVAPSPPSTINPALPQELDAVLLRALEKKPERRYDSVLAFAHAFQRAVLDSGNVHQTLTITALEARTGTNRLVHLPGGRQVMVPIPPGMNHGQVIRLEGFGRPTTYNNPVGELIVTIFIAPVVAEEAVSAMAPKFQHTIPAVMSPARNEITQSSLTLQRKVARSIQEKWFLVKKFSFLLFEKIKLHINRIAETESISTHGSSTIMFPESHISEDSLKDFFISYASVNKNSLSWGEWFKWQLDKAGYSTILPPWGIRADSNLEMEMQKARAKAKRILIVLCPSYLQILNNQSAWIEEIQRDLDDECPTILLIYVQECSADFSKLLESLKHINITNMDEIKARTMLLAAVGSGGLELTIQPIFPGNMTDEPLFPSNFPILTNSIGRAMNNSVISTFSGQAAMSLTQQIEIAFSKSDWSSVIRKVDYLTRVNPDIVSTEVYSMQSQAFLEQGDKQRAVEALNTALALVDDTSQRLILLAKYTDILSSLGRWKDVLSSTEEALTLVPNDSKWLVIQQQALTQQKNDERPSIHVKLASASSTLPAPMKGLEVFFSYSHRDRKMRNRLEKFLSNVKRQHSIVNWYDGEIEAGNEWAREIEKHLRQANIILLLVSQDFIASDFCWNVEMKQALERHDNGEAVVVPVLLRPAHWENTPFHKLQALPKGAKPIESWKNQDEAYLQVAKAIEKVVDSLIKNTDST